MDKPVSLSVKDFLIRKLAIKMLTPEKTIEAVVHHQFNSTNDAIQDDGNKTVELSGFGKFVFNQKKANKRMENLLSKKDGLERKVNDEQLSEQKRASSKIKLNNTITSIQSLKPKTNELFTDSGGMEEQPHTTSQAEADDKEC
jgi:nucleoid DNA-binding protein